MLEAQDMTPAGGEGTRIVTVPRPAGSVVTPAAYARREAGASDRASNARRAGDRMLPSVAATQRRRERRSSL